MSFNFGLRPGCHLLGCRLSRFYICPEHFGKGESRFLVYALRLAADFLNAVYDVVKAVSDKNIITLDRYNFVCRPGFFFATLLFRTQTRLSSTRMPGRQL